MKKGTRRIQAESFMNQVLPQEQTSLASEVSDTLDIMEPLVVKDQPTLQRNKGYGSMITSDKVLQDGDNVLVVSDQVMVSAIANLSTAYNLAVINYALMMLQRSYPDSSPELRSTVDSCSLVGAIVGQLAFGYVGSVMGRRKGMIFTLLLSILGAVASAILPWGNKSVYHILAACRFVLGVGVGGVYPLSAASAVESTDSDDELKKSKVVAAVFGFQGIGQLLAPLMAYIMLALNTQRSIGWRVLLLIGAFPGLFVLRRAFQVKKELTPLSTTLPIEPKTMDTETPSRSKLWSKVQASSLLQRKLFGASASWFLFDVTFYGNVIFTPIIMQDTYGLDKHHFADVALCSLVVAAIALPGNLLTVFIVGKMSFKTIQIMGFVVMALLFLALGLFYDQLLHHNYKGLLLGMYALTFFFSNFGPNVGTFCLPAELFAEDARVELNGVAAAVGKLGAAVGAASFSIIEARFGVSRLLMLSGMVSFASANLVKFKSRRRRADGNGNLTVEQKRRICEKHRNTPKITQKDLCRWAKLEFNLQRAPTQPTMSNILKHEHMFKDNVLGVLGSQRKTIRPTRHAHFDQVLANWVMERQNKGNITGDMIKTKGRELVRQMGLEGKLGFSNGWLASFKARHGLMKRTNNLQNDKITAVSHSTTNKDGAAYGGILDANSGMLPNGLSVDPNYMLPPVSMDLSIDQIQEMLHDYVPSDVYTVDETGLFFRASPNKLVQGDEAQSMLADEARLTVLLAVNADASDLMEPYIIGNVVPPKNIKMASISQLGYHYVCSSKARMTVFIFQQWLRDFNARMASAHRNVVLLMDNAPSHVLGCVALSNVRVVMFAPHLGMKVQPMRGGILSAFKGKYRLKHLTLAIDHLEDGLSNVYHVTQIQAMSWIVDAWQQISKEMIVNAWKPLGITAPFTFDSNMDGADDKNVEEELWGLLYCLQLSGIVNTKVLVNSRWENDIHKRLNEDMIEDPKENDEEFRMPETVPVNHSGSDHLSGEEDHHPGIQSITGKEQLKAFRDVIRHLERTGAGDSRDPQLMNVIEFLKKKQLSLRFDNASNSTLTI
ncbi:unnamed protein product [Peronospora belbahrii]|uniref:Major facilitator superfamily (MFS) profile domain-containing protein n=1 Tax=Peronospora belbahrii TaxID=622444 RepID=A0AAU9L9M9_9STRA|nr:unnamed protein product [Peronospora belbahrii]